MSNCEYKDIVSKLYDYSPFFSKYICNNSSVIGFYLNEAIHAKKILEFGSATGIFTIPLSKKGHYIDAIEISDDMIKIMKKKIKKSNASNIRIHKIDALNFKAFEQYEMVILPDSLLLAIDSKDNQKKLLEIAQRALKKGGKLLVDFFPPNCELIDAGIKKSFARAVDEEKKIYIVEREECWNSKTQKTELKYVHKLIDNEFNIVQQYESYIKYNYLHLSEVVQYLEALNFKIENCTRGITDIYDNYLVTAIKR